MFEGFNAADFDAFERKKWGSNVYTLERRAARDKLLALGEALASVDELDGFELLSTEDAPSVANDRKVKSIAAVFVRSAEERALVPKRGKTELSPALGLFQIALHQQHAHLFCELDVEGLTAGFRFPLQARVDRTNVAEILSFEWAREEFTERARAVAGPAELGLGTERFPLGEAPLQELAGRIEASNGVFSAERRWSRDDASLASDALLDELMPFLRDVSACFHFLAWSIDNDHGPLEAVLEETAEKSKAKQSSGMQPGARVTILSGLFSGRAGYLSEIDGKGRAKVMVGPVSVTVDLGDIRAQ